MTIYEFRKGRGRVFAFEIKNRSCGRRRVCSVVRKIPGAKLTKTPLFLSWFREEEFCNFQIGEVKFVAWEPYGDSSDYWIGPEDALWHPETAAVVRAFAEESVREGPFTWFRFVCTQHTSCRNHAAFEWRDRSASTPLGLEIALFVREVLASVAEQVRGLSRMSGLGKRSDRGWEFAIRIEGASLLVFVQWVGRWLIVIEPLGGPYALLRRWRKGDTRVAVGKANQALHAALVNSEAFSNVRWYTAKEFANRHGNSAAGGSMPDEV